MLDVVAEVEVQLVDDRERGDAHRVLDRVVRLGHGAHEVVRGDVAHHQEVGHDDRDQHDEECVERTGEHSDGDPQHQTHDAVDDRPTTIETGERAHVLGLDPQHDLAVEHEPVGEEECARPVLRARRQTSDEAGRWGLLVAGDGAETVGVRVAHVCLAVVDLVVPDPPQGRRYEHRSEAQISEEVLQALRLHDRAVQRLVRQESHGSEALTHHESEHQAHVPGRPGHDDRCAGGDRGGHQRHEPQRPLWLSDEGVLGQIGLDLLAGLFGGGRSHAVRHGGPHGRGSNRGGGSADGLTGAGHGRFRRPDEAHLRDRLAPTSS